MEENKNRKKKSVLVNKNKTFSDTIETCVKKFTSFDDNIMMKNVRKIETRRIFVCEKGAEQKSAGEIVRRVEVYHSRNAGFEQ